MKNCYKITSYRYLKDIKSANIFKELKHVFSESALFNTTVHNWVTEFKRGSTSVQNEFLTGRPKNVWALEMISKSRDMVLVHRRISIRRAYHILSVE